MELEELLNVIKLLLKGIHDRNLKLSLSDGQKETLNTYVDSVMKLVNELNEKRSVLIEEYKAVLEEHNRLEDEIIRIEILREKVLDKEDETLLDMDDLDTIKLISENNRIGVSVRKEILIKFIEYNNDRKEGKSKDNRINIGDVVKVFDKFNINISSAIKKHNEEVRNCANIENIESILTFMQSINIINRFDKLDLLTICLYGTVDSVKDAFEDISKKDDDSIYYTLPSIWIYNIQNRKIKKKKYKGQEIRTQKKSSLNAAAHVISKEEINRNIEYLNDEGFVFDVNDVGSKKALITPNYKLREAVRALRDYGIITPENISTFKIWILSEPQIVEKMDRFVEIGLLGGYNAHEKYANYLKKHPAKLHNIRYPVYMLLYKAKQTYPNDSYYELISAEKTGQLSGNINNGSLGGVLNTSEEMEEFKKENFANYESVINNYSLYENKIDSTFNVEIDKNIFYTDEIQYLEENYSIKDNPFVYVFDGLVISRLKVLRNYSLIHDGTKESLMTSIVKGSFLTNESLLKIANSIGFVLGGNDGLSKKI